MNSGVPGLRDVARLAGVSAKTVSNVVNGHLHVAPATRVRVQAAIAELGYRPNTVARQLRGGRTGIIALDLPDLALPERAALAAAVVRAAATHRWSVLLDPAHSAAEGVIAYGAATIATLPAPMVIVDPSPGSGSGPPAFADRVCVDGRAAVDEVTGHLRATGRRRIAMVGFPAPARWAWPTCRDCCGSGPSTPSAAPATAWPSRC